MGILVESPKRVVVMHQMGKVGSSAIYGALLREDSVQIAFTHILNRDLLASFIARKRVAGLSIPEHCRASKEVWRFIRNTQRPLEMISVVRDPMARNISAMFQNLPSSFGAEPTRARLESLTKRFMHEYLHSIPLRWFDLQMREPFGLNVYSGTFDHQRNQQVLESGRFRVLLLRAEDADSEKEHAVCKVMGLDHFKLSRANIGANKSYARLYQAFVRSFKPPEWLLEKSYQSQYCKHFYTPDEIARFRSRWTAIDETEAAA